MQDSFKTYRELLAERKGRGFSEQFLTELLRSVLPELVTMHDRQRAHGHISPDTLIHNPKTLQAGLKPSDEEVHADQFSVAKDIHDLGVAIITLLTGKRLEEMQDINGLSCWQDERLVSDNFAAVLNKAISNKSDLCFTDAKAMLYSLDSDNNEAFASSPRNSYSSKLEEDSLNRFYSISNDNVLRNVRDFKFTSISKFYFLPIIGALLAAGIAIIIGATRQRVASNISLPGSSLNPDQALNLKSVISNTLNRDSEPNNSNVYFSGISLPITNHLCNKKGTFCIYNLANLIKQESGQSTYSFSEMHNGEQVDIKGTIVITDLKRDGDKRAYTFSFSDDQNTTSQGWAAAGSFRLDQDSSRPGILTIFKTQQSFGPKTPVGLENTAYLFPQ